MFVRLFGNTNETRKQNGTLAENGVGKFADINDAALDSIYAMGFTHIWLTGVLQQATGSDYSSIGEPADDPDLLKGVAGSPYAIKDYFDVCPDYAVDPARRLDEFKALIERIHSRGMKAMIDLVPNHVARSYASNIKPELDFGSHDDASRFFSPSNNFYYLKPAADGPPVHLPTVKDGQPASPTCKVSGASCDGLFDRERSYGRVTGNDKSSWKPDLGDWYETVKLNYGFDFHDRTTREYPNASAPGKSIPDTWTKVAAIIDYWQSVGIDGFRCDMSHMVPPEFWHWLIAKARSKDGGVVFVGEAYDNDPAKVPSAETASAGKPSDVMVDLLNAGFTAVYDDPTYRSIKKIYESSGWANDIDIARDPLVFEHSLRYVENHDEVRVAAKSQWSGIGMRVGLPASVILYGLSCGPVMLYNGQEVGEPAIGSEGFGGDDARTSIFDYWSMPQFVKWVNDHRYDGGRLAPEQKKLRAAYTALLHAVDKPAFRNGRFIALNALNRNNPNYGRLQGETVSGHWLYSYARCDSRSSNTVVTAVNLNPSQAMSKIRIALPAELVSFTASRNDRAAAASLTDLLQPVSDASPARFQQDHVEIDNLPPLAAYMLELVPPAAQ